jgi:hypothetical protein
MQGSCALAVVALCGLARPASADGSLGAFKTIDQLLVIAMVIVGAIVVYVVTRAIRWLVRKRQEQDLNRKARHAPQVPPAYVVKDPRKPL